MDRIVHHQTPKPYSSLNPKQRRFNYHNVNTQFSYVADEDHKAQTRKFKKNPYIYTAPVENEKRFAEEKHEDEKNNQSQKIEPEIPCINAKNDKDESTKQNSIKDEKEKSNYHRKQNSAFYFEIDKNSTTTSDNDKPKKQMDTKKRNDSNENPENVKDYNNNNKRQYNNNRFVYVNTKQNRNYRETIATQTSLKPKVEEPIYKHQHVILPDFIKVPTLTVVLKKK